MSAPHVVGLGEAMVRLSTPDHDRLEQAGHLSADVGGAELNTLIAATASGLRATWLTRLAENPLGHRIAAHAARHGVGTRIGWDAGARAPLYFVEHGALPRPAEVLYDRSHSAMVTLDAAAFDWAAELTGAAAAVASGITSALGPDPAAAVRAFVDAARAAGARTVFDVNHRDRLWTWDEALPVLHDLLPRVGVLAASAEDLERLLGRDGPPVELARAAIDRWGHELVLLRTTTQLDGRRIAVEATAVTEGEAHPSGRHEALVVDAFGGGDAALGAFLGELLRTGDLARATDDAAWACALQHTFRGDAWLARPADRDRRGAPARRVLR